MDEVFGSALEKIKLQEQDEEIKLKEKRDYDNSVASLNRAIREASAQSEKSQHQQEILNSKIDILRTEIMLDKLRRDALSAQLDALKKEIEDLTNKCNEDISIVWKQRSSYAKEIHSTSDNYDIWPLLIKSSCTESENRNIIRPEIGNPLLESENRLQAAIERRSKAIAERDQLKGELNNGEEFVRIKNALQYSLDKIEELKKLSHTCA